MSSDREQPWDRGGRQCKAHTKRTGARCRQRAMPGALVCRKHGGAAPQVRAAAKRRLERQAAERAVATYGLPVEVEPEIALLQEVQRTAGHVAWLGQLVASLEQDDLKQRAYGEHGESLEAPSVWVKLYQDERKHLTQVCRAAIAAGIAERQIQLAEQHAELLARVIQAVIGDPELGLSRDQQARARVVFARHLRSIGGATA